MDSFWIGARKQSGVWMKSSGRPLNKVESGSFTDDGTGECLVADHLNNYNIRVVSCDESYNVSKKIYQEC